MRAALLFSLMLFFVVMRSTVGKPPSINTDMIYFPDQADYLTRAAKCPGDMVLWPGNNRCYKEGEQGPCNIGRVIMLQMPSLKPYCKDIL